MGEVALAVRDRFDWWRRALAGEQGLEVGEIPEQGFYRTRNRAGNNFEPVAYWFDDAGELFCKVSERMVDRDHALRIWPWTQSNPISHDQYKRAMQGEPWPDVNEAVRDLSNNPPDDESFDALQEAIDRLSAEADKLLKKGAAKTQAEADQASQIAGQLSKLEAKAEDRRKVEKKPHWDKAQEVDAQWNPLKLKADDFKKRLKRLVITPFLNELDRQRLAAEEAERKRLAEAAKSNAPVEAPKPMPKIETKAGGGIGRTVALQTVKRAVIEDRAKVLKHFKDSDEVTALLQSLCDKAARANLNIPGMKIVEEKVVR